MKKKMNGREGMLTMALDEIHNHEGTFRKIKKKILVIKCFPIIPEIFLIVFKFRIIQKKIYVKKY
jgi:hypothetical protein